MEQTQITNTMEPIHFAAIVGDLNQVKYLVDKGDPIDLRSNRGFTPLHHAVLNGHFEVAEFLIDNKCDINAKTRRGDTPLNLAASCGHFDIFKLLINRGVFKCSNPVQERIEQLHSACFHGYLAGVKYLAEKKCDLNALTARLETPILLAASRSHEQVVEFLVNCGVRLDCVQGFNHTVLHYAAEAGWLGVVRSVLEKNQIDINLRNVYFCSPLLLAARRMRKEVFDVLLESGAEIVTEDEYGNSVLHYAVEWEWVDVVEKCVEKYPNLDITDKYNLTPLMIACQSKNTKIVGVLLKAGASCIFRNKLETTAMTDAIESRVKDLNLFKLLIEYGAFLELSDHKLIKKSRIFKEKILKDAELCTQLILNKFNNQDLPTALKLSSGKLPSAERLKITHAVDKKVPEQIEEAVMHEIEAKRYCDVIVFRPMVLQMLAVQSIIKQKKQNSSLKRPAIQCIGVGCCSCKRVCSS